MTDRIPHCWMDNVEWAIERYGFGSPEWADAMEAPRGTCLLPDGHDGDHDFTPDGEIEIRFAPFPKEGNA